MALVKKSDILERAFVEGTTVFNEAYSGLLKGLDPWSQFTTVVPTMSERVDFPFLKDVPRMSQTKVVPFSDLTADTYSVTPLDWSAGLKIHKNELADDRLDLIVKRFRDLAATAGKKMEELAFDAVLKGIATTTYGACYDGLAFFSGSHVVGSGTDSNYDSGGGGTKWFLLDCSNEIKPILMALREDPEWEMENTGSHYFETGEVRCKVQMRAAVGYGMWQRAFCSTQSITEEYIWAGIQAMGEMTNDEGEKLGTRPTHLLVPPSLERTAYNAVNRMYVSDGTTTVSNEPVRGMGLKIVVSPWLA